MSKILGLDLGTNSIGWAVVDTEEEKPLLNKGVRIFSEGVNKDSKGNEQSKAAERTKFRSVRKMKFRRKLRKYETLKVLIKNNMCPLSLEELDLWKNKKIYPKNEEFINWLRTHHDKNPYYFRAKAVNEKLVNPLQLGRAYYHLAQRRGFKSNRLEAADDFTLLENTKEKVEKIVNESTTVNNLISSINDYFLIKIENDKIIYGIKEEIEDKNTLSFINSISKIIDHSRKNIQTIQFEDVKKSFQNVLNKEIKLGKVKQKISEISENIKKTASKTLGEYFYKLYQNSERIRSNYTHREEHYEKEFLMICEKQKINESLKTELHKAIFYQRPLRSQKGLVGSCTFETEDFYDKENKKWIKISKPRCPISHPLYEEYRMYAFINNIMFKKSKSDKFEPLTKEMRELIIPLFYRKSKANFDFSDIADKIGKTLKLKHAYQNDKNEELVAKADILFNYSYTTNVSGNPACAYLKDLLGEEWKNRKIEYSNKYKDKISKVDYRDIWHVLFTYESNEKLEEFAKQKLGFDTKQTSTFMRTPIKQGYAALSLKAIKKILPYLEEGLIFTFAVFLANIDEIVGLENFKKNEEEIREKLLEIINNHKEYKTRKTIVNEMIGWHKKIYVKPENKYVLDDADKKEIVNKCKSFFGDNTWTLKSEKEKNEILNETKEEIEELLKNSKANNYNYIKIERIDEKIKNYLKNEFKVSDDNLKKLYHPSDIDIYKKAKEQENGKKYLGSPAIDAVKNPVAMKTLHQLRHLVNSLIKEGIVDDRTTIHIELARDLNDANQRKAIERWQIKQRDERTKAVEEIKKLYFEECKKEIEPTEDEILKYQLWLEQNRKCLYTHGVNNEIGISQFIGEGNIYDIEHTIPRSISQDNSKENKTLCSLDYNRNIKKNKIPQECFNHDEILGRIQHWKEKFDDLKKEIEKLKKQSKNATSKEQKDRIIQEKHLKTYEYNYWKGKYERFTLKEFKSEFKNSQLNDTRIMTKYARAYMKSVFDRVFVVKGEIVDYVRKVWGLHDTFKDEFGRTHYKPKDRSNHIHHTKDAVVIACMTKNKFDDIANAWTEEDKGDRQKSRQLIEKAKPWKTFTQDVKAIEEDTLIYHVKEDNAIKPTLKKLRKRGKIQYKIEYLKDEKGNFIYNKRGKKKFKYILDEDGKPQPIYLQGDSIRGSLHKDTVYGAIQDKEYQGEETKVKYVTRKPVESLSPADIKNIVDDVVREKIETIIKTEGIAALKKEIWMNREKGIRINKVRIYTPTVTKPIHLKKHRDLSKHEYKHHKHVTNDENFMMVIYEAIEDNQILRNYELINLLDISSLRKNGLKYNKSYTDDKGVYWSLKYELKKGTIVLLQKENNEIKLKNTDEDKDKEYISFLKSRLYVVRGIDEDGIKLYFQQEARATNEVVQHMNNNIDLMNIKKGVDKKSKLTGAKGGDVVGYYKEFPYVKFKPSNFFALIEGKDFKLTDWGEIKKI